MAKALANMGHNVDVFVAGDVSIPGTEILQETASSRATLTFLPRIRIIAQNAIFLGLFRRLAIGNYDIVLFHEYDNITSLYVSMWCRRHGVVAILLQGMYQDYQGLVPQILQYIYDISLKRVINRSCNRVICKTSSAKEYLDLKGIHVDAVCHIGIDVANFTTEVSPPSHHGKKIILYVGVLEPRRNPLLMIDLMGTLVQRHFEVELWIVGKGSLLAQCKERVAKLGLSNHIRFLRQVNQSQLSTIYSQSHVLVLPSYYEIYGMVILEAMYHAVPVVSSRTAGSVDLIDSGHDGIVVDDFDVESWSRALEPLLQNESYRQNIGLNGRKKIVSNYLWSERVADFVFEFRAGLSDRKERSAQC
ncbi:glycosyltransferase family 4 protein [Gemmatimonadota bacterium]